MPLNRGWNDKDAVHTPRSLPVDGLVLPADHGAVRWFSTAFERSRARGGRWASRWRLLHPDKRQCHLPICRDKRCSWDTVFQQVLAGYAWQEHGPGVCSHGWEGFNHRYGMGGVAKARTYIPVFP